ncbi:hypothetical protein BWQ96_10041 [Gracilariopsis chorda]|uniref:Uncharacterized protein n=1 Tax=Gracilariopsis chorda TaxID=448386 RepID=A0A2V3IDU7_9FLOR|nr:hypothetical protein BWQ96_10041 [Gracilariopsis chorda]|eukprot:PXF40237.1 hypothetical protein BWQ96_10041 [Gracilariopsis chorda]
MAAPHKSKPLADATAAPSPSDAAVPNGSIVDASAAAPLAALQEAWLDVKDAVQDTAAYHSISAKAHSIYSALSAVVHVTKRVAWVLGTSSLVLVVPLLYEIDKEMDPVADTPSSATDSSPSTTSAGTTAVTSQPDAAPSAPQPSSTS